MLLCHIAAIVWCVCVCVCVCVHACVRVCRVCRVCRVRVWPLSGVSEHLLVYCI